MLRSVYSYRNTFHILHRHFFLLHREKSSKEIVRAFYRNMMENLDNKDFYGFLEPFAPVIDDVEFTQQQIAAVKVWKA